MMDNCIRCQICGHAEFESIDDGFFYCQSCGAQLEDMIETDVADEDLAPGGLYSRVFTRRITKRRAEQDTPSFNVKRIDSRTQKSEEEDKEKPECRTDKAYVPCDFGSSNSLSYEDYYTEIRMRYVTGIQVMIQVQCEVLVQKFRVNPLICGVIGPIWLRFLAASRVFDDGWADEAILESEIRKPGEAKDFTAPFKYRAEPHNLYGKRAVIIWLRSLRKKIPLCFSLAISFLACHVLREAILPIDIIKWSLEGKFPYLNVFVEIEKRIGPPSSACPFSSSLMFKPQGVQFAVESIAASIAEFIGLHLPPVNFYEISLRYLQLLGLPVDKILPHACKIYEWLMPPELWISAIDSRLPTHVYVMSIIIIAIRILYNINGFGAWEDSLSNTSISCSSDIQMQKACQKINNSELKTTDAWKNNFSGLVSGPAKMASNIQKSELDTQGLLKHLEAIYHTLDNAPDYAKDLPSYLKYCENVVFAKQQHSGMDNVEEKIIKQLWDFYKKKKDSDSSKGLGMDYDGRKGQKQASNDNEGCAADYISEKSKKCGHKELGSSSQELPESSKDKAIKKLKLNMEENMFCYVSPRVNIKSSGYLHYVIKKYEGSQIYAAHADYYILLRACARVAQVDVQYMHDGVLSLERRLAWTEKLIHSRLHLRPPNFTCKHCNDGGGRKTAENPK